QQSRSDLVTLDDFAALAQAAGLGRAQVQRRVREVAAKVRPAIDKIEQGHEIAREIAEIVEERSRRLAA
ncbi:MAG: hypothetical protein HUJ31_09395, partial [Pseudomonadales bacterium]|nr:hypothetical protein [Pseudomonadales bacterium]